MSSIVFDAGALIALERGERVMWSDLRAASARRIDLIVPSTVVAQVWRGRRSQATLARALAHCVVAPFDPRAREIGELCGRTRTSDICDAHVAIVAATAADVVYTSDPEDIERLLAACGGGAPTIVRC